MMFGMYALFFLIVFAQYSSSHRVARQAKSCAETPADIFFLIDGSSSEGRENFQREKDFVAKFINFLHIGPQDAQVAFGIFATQAKAFIKLNSYQDKMELVRAIQLVHYEYGVTNTNLGFTLASRYIFTSKYGDRANVPNIIYVLTDGHSQNHSATAQAAQQLLDAGTKIFAIGIGKGISMDELYNIASDREHVFTVDNFTSLDSIQNLVQATYCDVLNGTLCMDKVSNCSDYSLDICTQNPDWSQEYCPGFCSFCRVTKPTKTTPQATNPSTNYISTSTAQPFTSSTPTTQRSSTTGTQTPSLPISTTSVTNTTTTSSAKPTAVKTTKPPITTILVKSSLTSAITQTQSITTQPTTNVTTHFATPPMVPDGPCEDKILNCAGYGDSVCYNYRLWSIKNCARFCLFCHDKPTTTTTSATTSASPTPPTTPRPTTTTTKTTTTTRVYDVCEDKVDKCSTYGPDICFKYYSWAAVQCPKFCVFCEATTTKAPTTTTTTPTTTTTIQTTTTTTAPTTTFVCADRNTTECQTLGPIICFNNQTYAKENCGSFCTFCTTTTTTLKPFPSTSLTQGILIIGRK